MLLPAPLPLSFTCPTVAQLYLRRRSQAEAPHQEGGNATGWHITNQKGAGVPSKVKDIPQGIRKGGLGKPLLLTPSSPVPTAPDLGPTQSLIFPYSHKPEYLTLVVLISQHGLSHCTPMSAVCLTPLPTPHKESLRT